MAWRTLIDAQVSRWLKAHTAVQTEAQLGAAFRAFLTAQLTEIQVANVPEATEAVFQQYISDLNGANIALLQPEIEKTCNATMSNYTTRSVKAEIATHFPCSVFSSVNHFSEVLGCELNSLLDNYFTADSETRRSVKIHEIVLEYEKRLIDEYKKSKFDVFEFIEQDFSAFSSLISKQLESTQNCPIFDLDLTLFLQFSDQWKMCKGSMSNIADAKLPKSLLRWYKSRLKDVYVQSGLECINNLHLQKYSGDVSNVLYNLVYNCGECALFDDRIVPEEVKKVIFFRLTQTITDGTEESIEFLSELHKFLRFPADYYPEMSQFYPDFHHFQSTQSIISSGFTLLCILLILTRAVYVYIPAYINPEVSVRYTAKHRQLYRKIVTYLYRQQSEVKLIRVDEWVLGKPCETVLANFLKERNNPLLSSIPHRLLEESDKYGAEKAYELTDTPSGDQPGDQSWLQKVKKSVSAIVGQGFNWVSIKDVPSLSTTIVISGWQSDYTDPNSTVLSWSYLDSFPLEGTTIGLNWDSDTPFTSVAKTLLWIPLSFYYSRKEGTEFSWTVFPNACEKADVAGKILADNIERHAFGLGPVTLIGFSLGTRVIFSCLDRLRTISPDKLVENVILLGGAMNNCAEKWANAVNPTVAGDVINVYSSQDWTLRYLYTAAMHESPIGLGPIECDRVKNYDVESVVGGHQDHRAKMKLVFELIQYRP